MPYNPLTEDAILTAIRSIRGLTPFASPPQTLFEPTGSALDDLFLESVETTEKSSQEEFSPLELNTVKTNLMSDEGSRNYVYKDSLGFWTTGIGHLIGDGSTAALDDSEFQNIERRENSLTKEVIKNKGNYLTQDKIDIMFNEDFKKHIASARTIPNWDKADSAQREALVNLDFNMGKWWAKKHKNTVYKKDKKGKFIFDKEGEKIIKHKKGALVWPKARAALDRGDFDEVANQLENTAYSRAVGARADRVIKWMRGVDKGL